MNTALVASYELDSEQLFDSWEDAMEFYLWSGYDSDY